MVIEYNSLELSITDKKFITFDSVSGTKLFQHFIIFVLSYLPNPPLGQDMTQGQFLSGV